MGYKRKSVWEVTCETCGKVEEVKRNEEYYSYSDTPNTLPKGWVDAALTRTPNQGASDPPVCSEECLITYVKKRYTELTKPRAKKSTAKKTAAKKTTAKKKTPARRKTTRPRRR